MRARRDLSLQHTQLAVQVRRIEVQRRADEEGRRRVELATVRIEAPVDPAMSRIRPDAVTSLTAVAGDSRR